MCWVPVVFNIISCHCWVADSVVIRNCIWEAQFYFSTCNRPQHPQTLWHCPCSESPEVEHQNWLSSDQVSCKCQYMEQWKRCQGPVRKEGKLCKLTLLKKQNVNLCPSRPQSSQSEYDCSLIFFDNLVKVNFNTQIDEESKMNSNMM